ncbi:hypothetical protein [Rhodococcus gordoniae]|uniref:hypothetical protein n=1 Tax=Rhodococcus gordoniae TaxID=223392 RepID=UPI003526188D
MLIYATPTDYAEWVGSPPPHNGSVLLREASGLVADACIADVYDTDSNGLPTSTGHRDALRDATCAQAAFWAQHGIDPTAGRAGMAEVVTASSIDGASVSTNAGELEAAKAESLDGLIPSAVRILRTAGLGSNLVRSW